MAFVGRKVARSLMVREERDEYEKRLRKVVLWSADVLPDQVRAYIQRVREHGFAKAAKQVSNEYRPLIDNLPTEYVDFFIENMTVKMVRTVMGMPVPNYPDMKGLGLKGDFDFHPPSPAQGPFFLFLDTNEDEGLRLVNTLTNTAIEYWRLREQTGRFGGQPLTPIPAVVNLKSGPRNFWGDTQVYSWFRPTYNAPHVVSSALMALEMWLERQIEKGRDANELFTKVLSASDCIAVPAICIGITLAYQDKCIGAALPLIAQPKFWSMDIARYTFDLSHVTSGTSDPFGQYPFHASLMAERNKQPQRTREIRQLAINYLFFGNRELREPYMKAVSAFSENLPFTYEEEKSSPQRVTAIREQMEIFQVVGDPGNYRFEDRGNNEIAVSVEMPENIKTRLAEENEALNMTNRWMALCNWVSRSLKDGILAPGMTLDEAIASAKALLRPDDFSEPIRLSGLSHMRLEGIVGTAAVTVVLGAEWLHKQPNADEHIRWCRKVLMAASQTTIESLFDSRTSQFPFNPKATAALGLAALAKLCGDDKSVEQQILRLVGDPHIQVVTNVFRGLANTWETKPALCWNAFSLALAASMMPIQKADEAWESEDDIDEFRDVSESSRIEKLITEHLRDVERDVAPRPPRIEGPDSVNFLWDLVGSVIHQLPLSQLCRDPLSKEKVLRLSDDLLAWTITVNSPDEDRREPHEYFEWNTAYFDWATKLSALLSTTEVQEHLFNPIKTAWPKAPKLTTELLKYYVFNRLAFTEPLTENALLEWREICLWVLDDCRSEQKNYRLGNGVSSGALTAIVFIGYGGCLLKTTWPHARLFEGIIDQWVELVGSEPRRYGDLLLMLAAFWKQFKTSTILNWLKHSSSRTSNVEKFWHERQNADQTAELLQKIWHGRKEEVLSNPSLLTTYSTIVDELVITGVPLASALQQMLE